MTTHEIVSRIKFFRKSRNLSARELSLRLNKHETYINKLECTHFTLSMDMFMEILSHLNVPLEEFFAANYATFRDDSELFNKIVLMEPGSKTALLSVMRSMR